MKRVNDLASEPFNSAGVFAADYDGMMKAAELLRQALFERVSVNHVAATAEGYLASKGYSEAHIQDQSNRIKRLFEPWLAL